MSVTYLDFIENGVVLTAHRDHKSISVQRSFVILNNEAILVFRSFSTPESFAIDGQNTESLVILGKDFIFAENLRKAPPARFQAVKIAW